MQQVLCYFWRSIKMLLIYYKVELIPKWTKYCVLSTAGGDNANANLNNITFTIKDTKLFFSIWFYEQVTIKTYQNFLVKDLKDQFI